MKNPNAVVDYKKMEAYVKKNAEQDCGPVFGLDDFVRGVEDYNTSLVLRDLCVELADRIYTALEFEETFFNFIDDTRDQTLQQMLKSVVGEIIKTGKLEI